MIRYIALALVICVACRWLLGKWPWEYLSTRSSSERALDNARRLLAAWTGTRRHVRVRQLAVFAHAAGFAQRRVGTACSANLRSSDPQ